MLGIDEPPLADVYNTLIDVAPHGEAGEAIAEIVADTTGSSVERVRLMLDALRLSGALEDRGGMLVPEPVLAAAWLLAKQHSAAAAGARPL